MARKTKKGKERLDKFYQLAKDQGYRARSAFKLIQLAKKKDFLSKSRVCLDLCAAPGGWSQVAQKNMPSGSQIIAIDLAPIKALHGVTCIQSDITTEKCRSLIKKQLQGEPADVVLHDGAPNVGTTWARDAYGQAELTLHALKLAADFLRPGGFFVTKVFRSSDYNSLLWVFNQLFDKTDATKPTASRNVSAEIFVICMGFKGGKIDPKFFEPKWVFMEQLEAAQESGIVEKKPSATLTEHFKHLGRRHRGGYEPGDDNRVTPAADFFVSTVPAEVLLKSHQLNLDAPGSEDLKSHALTTPEVVTLCGDLKVCGKKDLSALLKWRAKILREREREERKARKAAEAAKGAASGAPAGDGADAGAADVDAAISNLLEGDKDDKEKKADERSSGEEDAELEQELAEQVDKRRKDERREAKRTMARQKKQEFRKKMSLHVGKSQQDQPELFRASSRNVQALEDEDQYVEAKDSNNEESSEEEEEDEKSDRDSDEELDRYALMEVDLAVAFELKKIRDEDKYRNKQQRNRKKAKETRRQKLLALWSGELNEFNQTIDAQAEAARALQDANEEEGFGEGSESEDDLQALRDFQKSIAEAEAGERPEGGLDAESLRALADGPPRAPPPEPKAKRKKIKGDPDDTGGAIVPLPEPGNEEALRSYHRSTRWFSQDIFAGIEADEEEREIARLEGRESDSDEDSANEVREISEDLLPKLPLTDKERRKLKRKKDKEKREKYLEKRGGKKKDEEDNKPMEVAPLEPPKPLVPTKGSKFKKPKDPQELAETLALGSLLVDSKKSRMEIIDAAYNRWAFDRDPTLPEWFTEEEDKHNKPELPISRELMDQFRAKLREINARPIRKVAQAKARKKRRLQKRLDKLRTTAMMLSGSSDMSPLAKAKQMRKEVSKLAKQDKRKVSVVAVKKGGGAKTAKGKIPPGSKVKVVDKRMKSDRRGEKKANKRNPRRQKEMVKKFALKMKRNQNKRLGGKVGRSTRKKDKKDGRGIYGNTAR